MLGTGKLRVFAAAGLAVLMLSGCGAVRGAVDPAGYRTSVKPPPGLIYTKLKAPVNTHFKNTVIGPKLGKATVHQLGLPPLPFPGLTTGLDLISWGDGSKEAAAANGGIQKVNHVDYEFRMYLMVYRQFTIEAYGE